MSALTNFDMNSSGETSPISSMTLSMLPDDCLRTIFLHLPVLERIRMRKVCRKWKAVSDDCWREMKSVKVWAGEAINKEERETVVGNSKQITIHSSNITFTVAFIRHCAPYLRYFKYYGDEKKLSITPAMKFCRNINELEMRIQSDSDDVRIANLFAVCRRIKVLKLLLREKDRCLRNLCTDSLTHLEVAALYTRKKYRAFGKMVAEKIRDCHSLETLHLVNTGYSAIFEAVGGAASLSELFIIWEEYYNDGLPCITVNDLSNIAKLRNLTSLDIHIFGHPVISDEFLESLSKNCKNLEHLELSSCSNITNEGLRLLSFLPKLIELDIHQGKKITDKYLPYFYKLSSLGIRQTNIRDPGVIALLRNSQCLEHLDLTSNHVTIESGRVAMEEVAKRTNNITLDFYY